ncbi:hypothetical protein BZARG_783 [Bizionia argentinensis JUB59]|uniref:Uncharacterized protein n=1 Tax=Bizionia argentinensis JUB59 TaxID=1046627 RepID=G2EBA0_9FLAO|nr:hypothetical protein [Bizionia argentinensis]EGV44339.1 hypothetical protein BZARG_783 [Bizionia argentinensis JUB59]
MQNDQVFKQHPNLESYYQTSDETNFFKDSDAHVHAKSLKGKRVTEIVNENPGAANVSTKQTVTKANKTAPKLDDLTPMQKAKLRIEAIEVLETVEAVTEALKDETAKTVIAAGEARIEALELDAKILESEAATEPAKTEEEE